MYESALILILHATKVDSWRFMQSWQVAITTTNNDNARKHYHFINNKEYP